MDRKWILLVVIIISVSFVYSAFNYFGKPIIYEKGKPIVKVNYFTRSETGIKQPIRAGSASLYGCTRDTDCRFIKYKADCSFEENNCNNINEESIIGGKTYTTISPCNRSSVIIDDTIKCECKLQKTNPEPCVTNTSTGQETTEQETCVWIEDNIEYGYCSKAEELINKPDLTITDFNFLPQNPSVGENVNFTMTIKNIGNGYCSELFAGIGFGDQNVALTTITYECHFIKDAGCFEPGASTTVSFAHTYASSGSYLIDTSTMCFEPESDNSNNNLNATILISR